MISILSSKAAPSKVVDGATKSREVFCLVGLSSDTKPTTSYRGILICNGSVYDEIDTGKEYLYDEAGGEWHEQPEGDKKKDDPTAEEISVSRGSADAGKVIVVGNDGKLLPVDLEVGEGQIAVDGTLKIPGAAADAKKTGDAIASLNGSLANKAELPIVSKNIEVTWDAELDGNYIDANGNIVSSESYHVSDLIEVDARSAYVLDFTNDDSATGATRIHAYDSDGLWISRIAYRTNTYRNVISFVTDSKTRYIRISIHKTATINYLRKSLMSEFCFDASYMVSPYGTTTYSVDPEENSITINSKTAGGKYQSVSTGTAFAEVQLEAGSLYEWHYKAQVVSGSPTIRMVLRNSNDQTIAYLLGSDGEESSGYFIAKKEMRKLTLFCSYTTALSATVKYYDIWIKKVESQKDEENLIRQSKYGDSNSILQIVHFSDIHGDTVAIDTIVDFINKHPVDDVISAGDAPYWAYGYAKLTDGVPIPVDDYNEDTAYVAGDLCVYEGMLYKCVTPTSGAFNSSDWAIRSTGAKTNYGSKNAYLNSELATLSLFCIGNHDTMQYVYNPSTDNASNVTHWYDLPREYAYNTWIAPYKDGWGITTPGGTELYWYKDYPTQKVRIVSIDMQYWNADESTWLDATLAAAQTLGYGVILLSHSLLGAFVGNPDVTFHYLTATNTSNGEYKSDSTGSYGAYRPGYAFSTLIPYRDIIICNLCGHSHIDRFGYTKLDDTENRQLLTIQIDQAGILREVFGADRSAADTRYVFNLLTVDTSTKVLKIVRFGNNMDMYLRSKKTLCVQYETGEILAND